MRREIFLKVLVIHRTSDNPSNKKPETILHIKDFYMSHFPLRNEAIEITQICTLSGLNLNNKER